MCRNLKQARTRSGEDLKMNKGYECAISLLNLFKSPIMTVMLRTLKQLKISRKTRYAARGSMCRLIAEALRTIQESAKLAYHKISD